MTSVIPWGGSMLVCDSPSECCKWSHNNMRFARDCFQWTKTVYFYSSITPTNSEYTHTQPHLGEWGEVTCAAWVLQKVQVAVSCMRTDCRGKIRFHLSLFLQTSLCRVIKFKPYLSQPHLFPSLSSLCSAACSDLLGPCGDTGPRSGGPVRAAWLAPVAMLCRKRHFHTSSPPSLIPELPLRPRFISSWLLSVGYILKVELADKRTVTAYRSSGTFPECSSESSKQLKVLLAVISWACFPHIPGSVVALLISWYLIGNCLWYLIGKCVFWCLYCIIHVIYILKSNFYWHWWNFLYF